MNQKSDIRVYGREPFRVAVIHGGPGAPGYMAPVARELSRQMGVLEPLQTSSTLDGQIDELRLQLESVSREPFVLIGSSWGAVLALLVAAWYPHLASKLILIGSAVFDAESSRRVKAIRLERTPQARLEEIQKLEREMAKAPETDRNRIMTLIADLEFDPDVYDPLTRDLEAIDTQREINQSVWRDFVKFRDKSGALFEVISQVDCDTLIIHGDHDPHIIEGIHPFLKSCIPGVRLEWLEKCGHYPWIEREARQKFFDILMRECDLRLPS